MFGPILIFFGFFGLLILGYFLLIGKLVFKAKVDSWIGEVIDENYVEKEDEVVDKEVKRGNYVSKSEFFRYLLRLWMEGKLAYDLEQSRKELNSGKGKLLKSLKDLR